MPDSLALEITLRRPPLGEVAGDYRPHLRVGSGEYLGVRILVGPPLVQTGTPTRVIAQLLYNVDYSALVPGAVFDVLEGPAVVGSGVVVGTAAPN
jgi:hypothetical protein